MICQQIFSILALVIFLDKFLLKSASFDLASNYVLELQFPTPLRVVLLCFAIQCLQIALQWLRLPCVKALCVRASCV